MIFAILATVTLLSAAYATIVQDIRRSILALWIVGLGVGAIYLTIGAELLAIIQWIVSTLVAISFVFFSAMFGEHVSTRQEPWTRKLVVPALSVAVAVGFVAVIWLAGKHFPAALSFPQPAVAPDAHAAGPTQAMDLVALGQSLVEDHLVSLEVLALMLLLVLIGSGVIARPEAGKAAQK